ncbi:MAG: hypothetical protein ACYTFG_05020 [Planctomycetota bacterium]|jgi:hypothetical protein
MKFPTILTVTVAVFFLGTVLPLPKAAAQGGKLKALEDKLKKKKKDRSADSSRSTADKDEESSYRRKDKDGKDLGDELFTAAVIFLGRALFFPWWSFKYQSFPYEEGDGYLDYAGDTPWTEPGDEYKVGRVVTGEIRTSYIIDSEVLQGYRF